ncbi:MAG: WD40 repeat domain-containing protein [Fimbriimonadales bacterium]
MRGVASSDRTTKVWELHTERLLRTLKKRLRDVNCVAVSADGRRAVSSSSDRPLTSTCGHKRPANCSPLSACTSMPAGPAEPGLTASTASARVPPRQRPHRH